MSYQPSPELIGLLGELSEQQERVVLAAGAYRRKQDEPVSARMAGLSNLEREILRAHREEAAYLLNYLAYLFSYEEPNSFLAVDRWVSPEQRISPQQSHFEVSVRRLLEANCELPTAVLALLSSGMGGRPSTGRAAALSSQLVDSGYSKLQLSISMLLHGNSSAGVQEARNACSLVVKSGHLFSARLALGIGLLLEGHADQAWEYALQHFCDAEKPFPNGLMFGFIACLATDSTCRIHLASRRFNESFDRWHPGIRHFLELMGKPGTAHHQLSGMCKTRPQGFDPDSSPANFVLHALSS